MAGVYGRYNLTKIPNIFFDIFFKIVLKNICPDQLKLFKSIIIIEQSSKVTFQNIISSITAKVMVLTCFQIQA